jgi:Putative Flp pilus-assembly TadE/G-like
MRRAFRRRQRGQTIVFAAVAMVAIVGGLAIVVDAGIFFVVQRQFQTAADAGALAGAWHNPICPSGPGYSPPCQTSQAMPNPVGIVAGTPPECGPPGGMTPACAPCPEATPGFPACDVALANANTVAQLCSGPVHAIVSAGTTLVNPSHVNVIVVIVQCDAGYSFGQILNLSTKRITASAAAALGNRDATNSPQCSTNPPLSNGGDMTTLTANPPCGFIARLIE